MQSEPQWTESTSKKLGGAIVAHLSPGAKEQKFKYMQSNATLGNQCAIPLSPFPHNKM